MTATNIFDAGDAIIERLALRASTAGIGDPLYKAQVELIEVVPGESDVMIWLGTTTASQPNDGEDSWHGTDRLAKERVVVNLHLRLSLSPPLEDDEYPSLANGIKTLRARAKEVVEAIADVVVSDPFLLGKESFAFLFGASTLGMPSDDQTVQRVNLQIVVDGHCEQKK